MTIRTLARSAAFVAAILAAGCNGCRTAPSVPAISDATYRDAVIAFYTGLAAMQTSQDEMAREKLDRVTTLVPAGASGLGESRAAVVAAAGDRAGDAAPRQGGGTGAVQRPPAAPACAGRGPPRQSRRPPSRIGERRRRTRSGRRQGCVRPGAGDGTAGRRRARRRGAGGARGPDRAPGQPGGTPRPAHGWPPSAGTARRCGRLWRRWPPPRRHGRRRCRHGSEPWPRPQRATIRALRHPPSLSCGTCCCACPRTAGRWRR